MHSRCAPLGGLGCDYEARVVVVHRDAISFTSDMYTIVNGLPKTT